MTLARRKVLTIKSVSRRAIFLIKKTYSHSRLVLLHAGDVAALSSRSLQHTIMQVAMTFCIGAIVIFQQLRNNGPSRRILINSPSCARTDMRSSRCGDLTLIPPHRNSGKIFAAASVNGHFKILPLSKARFSRAANNYGAKLKREATSKDHKDHFNLIPSRAHDGGLGLKSQRLKPSGKSFAAKGSDADDDSSMIYDDWIPSARHVADPCGGSAERYVLAIYRLMPPMRLNIESVYIECRAFVTVLMKRVFIPCIHSGIRNRRTLTDNKPYTLNFAVTLDKFSVLEKNEGHEMRAFIRKISKYSHKESLSSAGHRSLPNLFGGLLVHNNEAPYGYFIPMGPGKSYRAEKSITYNIMLKNTTYWYQALYEQRKTVECSGREVVLAKHNVTSGSRQLYLYADASEEHQQFQRRRRGRQRRSVSISINSKPVQLLGLPPQVQFLHSIIETNSQSAKNDA
ncbi:unnamed protein product [Trichogramma brassicae]|uniref:Uncharacterized protein n=1 Tax=Trichogramma brassicae TaxID=86971 RepID=A0A6H5I2Y2_9HYME|nr:unnamed protein product [Trichogramma brassicae]